MKIQYNRNRYYDYYTGRWLQAEKLGMIPNDAKINPFSPLRQYIDGMSLYEYAWSDPVVYFDPTGLRPLRTLNCLGRGCPRGFLDPLPSRGRGGDWGWINALLHYIGRSGTAVEFSHTSKFAERVASYSGPCAGISPTWNPLKDKIRTEAKSKAEHLEPCACTAFGLFGESHEKPYLYYFGGPLDWEGTIHEGKDDDYADLLYTVRCCVKKGCDRGELVCRVRFDMRDTYSFDAASWWLLPAAGKKFNHKVNFDKTLDETISLP